MWVLISCLPFPFAIWSVRAIRKPPFLSATCFQEEEDNRWDNSRLFGMENSCLGSRYTSGSKTRKHTQKGETSWWKKRPHRPPLCASRGVVCSPRGPRYSVPLHQGTKAMHTEEWSIMEHTKCNEDACTFSLCVCLLQWTHVSLTTHSQRGL